MSNQDLFNQAAQAEGLSQQQYAVALSIFGQESAYGRNAGTSTAGAKGFMQVMPATFAQMADKGWSINDPNHNLRAGMRYIKYLNANYAQTPWEIAVGYYGGPGAIGAARQGKARYDKTNSKAPSTLQYADQVVNRMHQLGFGDLTGQPMQGGEYTPPNGSYVPTGTNAPYADPQYARPSKIEDVEDSAPKPMQIVDAISGQENSAPSLDQSYAEMLSGVNSQPTQMQDIANYAVPATQDIRQYLDVARKRSEQIYADIDFTPGVKKSDGVPMMVNGEEVLAIPTSQKDKEFFAQLGNYPEAQQGDLVRSYVVASPVANAITSKPLFSKPQNDILNDQLRTIVEAV